MGHPPIACWSCGTPGSGANYYQAPISFRLRSFGIFVFPFAIKSIFFLFTRTEPLSHDNNNPQVQSQLRQLGGGWKYGRPTGLSPFMAGTPHIKCWRWY